MRHSGWLESCGLSETIRKDFVSVRRGTGAVLVPAAERTGDASNQKSVHLHIHYGLFAEILHDLARTTKAMPIDRPSLAGSGCDSRSFPKTPERRRAARAISPAAAAEHVVRYFFSQEIDLALRCNGLALLQLSSSPTAKARPMSGPGT
jgi:hypothetical protein